MIREATVRDASRLAEILIFAKRCAYRPIFNDDLVSFNELSVLELALHFRDDADALNGIYVYDDGIVRGLMHIREHLGEGQELILQLEELYVDPFFQKQGTGRILMRDFLGRAAERKAESVFLWTLEKNIRARKFYESFGFREAGERKQEPGTDEYILKYGRRL